VHEFVGIVNIIKNLVIWLNFMNYLNVSFTEKDYAKSLVARSDTLEKRWYTPDGLNLELFEKWLPSGSIIENSVTVYPTSKGITLLKFLRQLASIKKGSAKRAMDSCRD
jgi:hypothetical protein